MTLAPGASSAPTQRLAALLDETPDHQRDDELQFVRDGSWKASIGYPLNTD
jgi:hypothetical protein